MQRTQWIERKFTFDFPEGWLPDILERLRGTAPRLKEMLKGCPEEVLTDKAHGWSVKEHVGHLTDLEDLHESRIDDLIAWKTELPPADMSNTKTNAADHNEKGIHELISMFEDRRNRLVKKILSTDDATQLFSSLHPRLKVKMRPVDVAFFASEHDDHHLASIRALLDIAR